MTAEWSLHVAIAQDGRFLLNDIGHDVRVKVQVHPENVASGVVSAANGAELNVALVCALRPVHDVVLSIDTEIESRDREAFE